MADDEHGFERRLAGRTRNGLIVGAIAGAVIGVVAGAVAGGSMPSLIMWTLSLALAGLVVGGIWGGFTGLESPDPGAEPTGSSEPLAEPPVTEERNPSIAQEDG
jgi:hypothetical protein